MLLRRAVAVCAAACLAGGLALAGCDDGPPAATVGKPDASTVTEPAESPYPTYVALGDSYTAAPGVPDTEQLDGCLRSNGNYANLVAAGLGSQFVDVSCVGATTLSLTSAQKTDQHSYKPQLDALGPDTSLVTLGIGGNDLELFQLLIGSCIQVTDTDPEGSPCEDYFDEQGKHENLLLEKVHAIGGRVAAALKAIHRTSPHAKLVLVGYPQPVPAKGTCKILPLAKDDYPFVRSVGAALNHALERAARKARATYVDVMRASKGHDICAGQDAWVNGINTDVEKALAFHPFANEQEAVAKLILNKLGQH